MPPVIGKTTDMGQRADKSNGLQAEVRGREIREVTDVLVSCWLNYIEEEDVRMEAEITDSQKGSRKESNV